MLIVRQLYLIGLSISCTSLIRLFIYTYICASTADVPVGTSVSADAETVNANPGVHTSNVIDVVPATEYSNLSDTAKRDLLLTELAKYELPLQLLLVLLLD